MTQPSRELLVPTLGVPTRAWEYGNPAGDPMILVHGFRGDHHGLERLALSIAHLKPFTRLIVPDLPGFGLTPAVPGREHGLGLYAQWLRSFTSQVVNENVDYAILAHSFGTLVTSKAIAEGLTPNRTILINPISSLALTGPQAALTALAVAYYRCARALPDRAARKLLSHRVIVRLMSEVMTHSRDPKLRSWIHKQHAAYFSCFSDASTLLQAFEASVSHTVTDFAQALRMPTLLIVGDRDDITPLTRQLELSYRIGGALLRIITGTGHLVHYEAVEDAAAFTVDFLHANTSCGM